MPRSLRRLRDALNTMDAVVQELITARQASPDADPGDHLGLLLAARDEEGRAMSRRQVRDELVTFLLAGHETTANGLAWMWYLLSKHPEARERMVAEVDQVLDGRTPTADDAERLPFTAACFQEALRLYSPVWIFEREAVADDEIDGHRIPAGSTIFITNYLVHRNPRVWPRPAEFDPTRFLPDQVHGHPRCAYLPFGAGRRVCIGAGFSILEATLIAAMIAQRFILELADEARVEPETTITLRPRWGLPMTLHHRGAA
jgi:cytochrome P450